MAVEGFLAAGFYDMEVDVGGIGVPGENNAHVDVEVVAELFIEIGDGGFFAVLPILAVDPGDEGVEFFEGEKGDAVGVAGPGGEGDFDEEGHGFVEVGGGVAALAAFR